MSDFVAAEGPESQLLDQSVLAIAGGSDISFPLVLCAFAAKNDLANVRTLLDVPDVDPNKPDYDGRTPLHLACDEGAYEVAALLIERNANVHAMDRWGNTPLLCAYSSGHQKLIELLKSKGAFLRVLQLPTSLRKELPELTFKDTITAELQWIFERIAPTHNSKDSIPLDKMVDELVAHGLDVKHNPLVRKELEMFREGDRVTWPKFRDAVFSSETTVERCLLDKFAVHDWNALKATLTQLYNEVKDLKGGEVATYIPELANADPDHFAISVCTVDGQIFNFGDHTDKFPIESAGKPFLYSYALEEYGEKEIHKYVGREPSGAAFNAFTLNHENKPHNACINAGAIVVSSMFHPKVNASLRYKLFTAKLTQQFGGWRPGFDQAVYLSEKDTAHTNFALTHFMAARGSLPPEGLTINDALDFYFQVCSTEANVQQMAIAAATYAKNGVNPLTGERVMKEETVKHSLQLLFSCGMYDYSGEWACTVGLPSKSGVSGIIYLVVPDVMGVAIYSPPLDNYGNSFKGVEFAKRLTEKYQSSFFDVCFRKRDEEALHKRHEWVV